MLYTISYEITASLLIIFIFLIVVLFYGRNTRKDRYFELMLILAQIVTFADIFYGVGLSKEGHMYECWSKYGLITRNTGIALIVIAFVAYIISSEKTRSKRIAYVVFGCISVSSIIIFYIFPQHLVIGFGVAVGLLVLLFTLETPDYELIIETTKQLEKSRAKEIEAKNEANRASLAKSRFLANMTHEIRTPINAILGLDEIMLRESNEPEVITYASKMRVAGNTLLGIVNDILDYSKIESGKMQLIYSNYNLRKLLEECVANIEPELLEKGIELVLDINKELPVNLIGDDVRLKQIITNLLNNAVKYTEKGSVTFYVDGFVENDEETKRLILKVKIIDTGIGIQEDKMSKLFENFGKVDSNKEGIGIGLNVSVLLLKLMNSKLEVSSEFGVGSEFSFEVSQIVNGIDTIGEINHSISQENTRYYYKESFTAKDASVLVVDDTELNLFVIKKLLGKTLMKIDTANNGFECIEKIKDNKYDIILMDHMMPGMDGIETAKNVWKQEGNENIPIVALTASTASDNIDLFYSNNFSGFLTKPIEQDKLEAMIKELIPEKLIGGDNS